MIVHPESPPGKAGGGNVPVAPADPRLAAFAGLLAAFDRADPKAGILATRELRRLGFSVCLTTPRGHGGGR